MSKASYDYFKGSTVTTTVHECTHGINADLRNRFFPGKMVNCFYLMDSNYVYFDEPPFRKRDVIPFIPSKYKSSSLYGLYVTSPHWDDRPLYLWDEWVAYVNGAMTGAEYSIKNSIIFGYFAGAVLKKMASPSFEARYGLLSLADILLSRLPPSDDVSSLFKWLTDA
jgi:hypothetical protein